MNVGKPIVVALLTRDQGLAQRLRHGLPAADFTVTEQPGQAEFFDVAILDLLAPPEGLRALYERFPWSGPGDHAPVLALSEGLSLGVADIPVRDRGRRDAPLTDLAARLKILAALRFSKSRRSPRLPCRFEVEIEGLGRCEARDLNGTGVFCYARHPMAIGAVLRLRFCLPEPGQAEISCGAEVVHVEAEGVGLSFMGLGLGDAARIKAFVDARLEGSEPQAV